MITNTIDLILEPRPFAATLHEFRADLRGYFTSYGWPAAWVVDLPEAAELPEYEPGAAAFRVHGHALTLFEILAKAHGFTVWG